MCVQAQPSFYTGLYTCGILSLSISNFLLLALNQRGLGLVLATLSCLSSLSFLLEVMDHAKDFLALHAEANRGVLPADCMPFQTKHWFCTTQSEAGWMLALADPVVCLLMLPPVSLSIQRQQFSRDCFVSTYTHRHICHVRCSLSAEICPTHKPTNVPSAFCPAALTVPSKKGDFCGFGLGRKHS